MRIFVTGATGFVGSHLIDKAVAAGHSVRAHIRSHRAASEVVRRLEEYGAEISNGELNNSGYLADILDGVNVVLHLAWQSNRVSTGGGSQAHHADVDVMRALSAAARDAGVQRLLFASSVSVYGERSIQPGETLREDDPLTTPDHTAGPLSNYAVSKIEAEELLRATTNLEHVIVRPSMVYGAGARFGPAMVRRAMRDGSGGRTRPHLAQWIHVDDMARMLLLLVQAKDAANETFLIAGAEPVLSDELNKTIGAMARKMLSGQWQGWDAPAFSLAPPKYDIAKLSALGITPEVPFQEGLEDMVAEVVERRLGRGSFAEGWRPGADGPPPGQHSGESNEDFQDRVKKFYTWHLNMEEDGSYVGGSDFWNYGLWRDGTASQKEACENLVEELLSFIPDKSGNIVDVACGKGATTAHLLRYYPAGQVTAINIAEDQIEKARENAPGVSFRLMDAAKLDFDDNEFDNMVCIEAAFHFETREQFLKHAHRVLKPGGRLVFTDCLQPVDAPTQSEENYLPSVDALRQLCSAAGFDEVHIRDAIDECWIPMSKHFTQYMLEKAQAKKIPWRQYISATIALERTRPESYVVGWCRKA